MAVLNDKKKLFNVDEDGMDFSAPIDCSKENWGFCNLIRSTSQTYNWSLPRTHKSELTSKDEHDDNWQRAEPLELC